MKRTDEFEKIESLLKCLTVATSCDEVRSGGYRIATPFSYPNGSFIDVFVDLIKTDGDFSYMVSDYGQTLEYLRQVGIANIDDLYGIKEILICLSLRIEEDCITDRFSSPDEKPFEEMFRESFLRVVQACICVSCFVTYRSY